MTTDYDYTDAPPLDDYHAPTPGVPSPDATAISIALNRIAAALERLSVSPGGAPASAPPPIAAPSAPPGGPTGGKTTQQKRGGLIWGKCKDNNWDVADIGQRVCGRVMPADSRTWPDADQIAVLEAMKEWGVIDAR